MTAKCQARVQELEDAIRTGTDQQRLVFEQPAEPSDRWPESGPTDCHGRRTLRAAEAVAGGDLKNPNAKETPCLTSRCRQKRL